MKQRRYLFFFIFFPALLLPAYAFLGWRLAGFSWKLAPLALPFLSVACFPFLALVRGRKKSRIEWFGSQLAYLNMGFVSFLLVTTVIRDLLGVVGGHWLSSKEVLALALIALALASYRGIYGPSVRRITLDFPDLPEPLRGLKIVQLSDLHISASIGEGYVKRVVAKALAEKPHLIALTGDIGDGRVEDHPKEILALAALAKDVPVFYVPGNHEVYWNHGEWMGAFEKSGFRVLLNRGEELKLHGKALFVAGITDPAFLALGPEHGPDLKKAMLGGEAAPFKILLSHRPDFADEAAALSFDLQLSGHTHGGQFFPWTIVASLVHRYSLGAYQIGKMWVYVSAGTGSWGPRLRLGTRAEVTLIELA